MDGAQTETLPDENREGFFVLYMTTCHSPQTIICFGSWSAGFCQTSVSSHQTFVCSCQTLIPISVSVSGQ
ncbi:MAG: hypothetical protein HY841_11130 [Bacteroidetes bacterium]|nr:hypothetical protein [Bacteroidota bacterium]